MGTLRKINFKKQNKFNYLAKKYVVMEAGDRHLF